MPAANPPEERIRGEGHIRETFSMPKRIALSFSIVSCLAVAGAGLQDSPPRVTHEPVVEQLITMLDARPDLKATLLRAIEAAGIKTIESLDAFYDYVDELVTWIPVEREAVPKVLSLHYVVNQAPGNALNEDEAFSAWMRQVAEAWGEFLDTPASAAGIESFASLPNYRIDDYVVGPSGWLTFNQFFAREMRPGKRPVSDPCDDTVIVSPADAVFMGAWPIGEHSTVTVKGAEWSIAQLLDGSPYADAFKNGTYMHSFLNVDAYHRYHVPIGGVVKEVRNVHGRVYLDVVKRPDGSLASERGDTFQFNQERGLVVIDSPVLGLVAVVPVGMSFISSVNLTPQVGAELRKGDEFGYFQFGGSDIVIVFQDRNVVLEAEKGRTYLQGQRIGHMEKRTSPVPVQTESRRGSSKHYGSFDGSRQLDDHPKGDQCGDS
jgi:phosphatidylserine decarboxylase